MHWKYDLDYLQWLQKNARLYLTGLFVLTCMITFTICLYLDSWQPQNSMAFLEKSESDQAVAEQQIPANQTESNADVFQPTIKQGQHVEPQIGAANKPTASSLQTELAPGSQPQGTSTATPTAEAKVQLEAEEQAEEKTEEKTDSKAEPKTVDVLQLHNRLSGFTLPCSANLVYGYGIGYDPNYEDYRFHNAVCYQANGATIFAVSDGVVQHAEKNSDWQLILRCDGYQICYQGLQTCTVSTGQQITGGQPVGKAGDTLLVKAVQ